MNFETLSLEDLSQCVHNFGKEVLLLHTKSLVEKERDLTAKSLVLFREIESRMIHLEMGYGSLFDMLVQYFALSEGCASRRVASVRLMTQVPDVEKKIRDGSLSLSNVAAAQRFFSAEAKNRNPLGLEEKKEILNSLEGKSVREAEKELIQRSSLPIALQIPDQIKPKGEDHVEIRFLAPQGLADLLEEAKGLLAHRLPHNASMAEVVQALTEMGIERIKKERFGVGSKPRRQRKEEGTAVSLVDETLSTENPSVIVEQGPVESETHIPADVLGSNSDVVIKPRSRHIPMSVRRAVFVRAAGKCEYIDTITGRRCNSSTFLELDHQIAFAKQGKHSTECLILACRHHNGLRAVKDFSSVWMSQFK